VWKEVAQAPTPSQHPRFSADRVTHVGEDEHCGHVLVDVVTALSRSASASISSTFRYRHRAITHSHPGVLRQRVETVSPDVQLEQQTLTLSLEMLGDLCHLGGFALERDPKAALVCVEHGDLNVTAKSRRPENLVLTLATRSTIARETPNLHVRQVAPYVCSRWYARPFHRFPLPAGLGRLHTVEPPSVVRPQKGRFLASDEGA
jgi:hypothetical protein